MINMHTDTCLLVREEDITKWALADRLAISIHLAGVRAVNDVGETLVEPCGGTRGVGRESSLNEHFEGLASNTVD